MTRYNVSWYKIWMIDIRRYDKADVLRVLYNDARPQGLGFLHYELVDMLRADAEELLADSRVKYFDYLKGRIMKVDLNGDEFDPRLYDRDNGDGAAARAIAKIAQKALG